MIIKSFLAILVATFLIWGIWNEEKLAALENRLFDKISNHFKPKYRYFAVEPRSTCSTEIQGPEFYNIKLDSDNCA